ncbi:MAG TPA: alcohol dehydrogenase catalytic domain-containing protein, partial [Thermoanaerobaculia bacterium]|nr:alcohol dehydrogenase catalytic domain-containing protein [Thermoanaerobaculia bacterium]
MPTLTPPLPRTMTVAACTPEGGVRLESRPLPEPGPGELRLRLRGAGLCGTDLFKLRYGTAAEGMVLGHEVVGTVDALGPGTVGFLPGDRVVVPHHVACGECDLCLRGSETLCPVFRENLLVPGGFAEHILVRERAVRLATFSLPGHLADEAAVFLEPAACVLRGLRHARLEETALPTSLEGHGPVAAVLGGGSMGLLHLLVARALFPDVRIVISDPLPERRALALRLGADAAAAPGQEVRQAVAGLSGGRGADVIFDTAGGARALDEALGLTREGGAVVLFAHGAENETAGFGLNTFFKGERRLLATYSSSLADQRDIYRLLVSGRLDPSPLVTHRLPLSRFGEAVSLARDQQALKVL